MSVLTKVKKMLGIKPQTAMCAICETVIPEDEGRWFPPEQDLHLYPNLDQYFVCYKCEDTVQEEGLSYEYNEESDYKGDIS